MSNFSKFVLIGLVVLLVGLYLVLTKLDPKMVDQVVPVDSEIGVDTLPTT